MNGKKMKSAILHLIGKCITVGGTLFLSNAGMDKLIAYIEVPTNTNFLALKAVSLLATYAVWTKAIIPFLEGLAESRTTAGKVKNEVKAVQYLKF